MNYEHHIKNIHQELGIATDYAEKRQLTLQVEAKELIEVDTGGSQDRVFQLGPETANAWEDMHTAALLDNVTLLIGSAFRSVDYQAQIIATRVAKGRTLENVLLSIAAPGYSEHHTGQAIDIITLDSEPFSEHFELTPAFSWLQKNAGIFGFTLSFPRGNPHGFVYEPWHWRFRPTKS